MTPRNPHMTATPHPSPAASSSARVTADTRISGSGIPAQEMIDAHTVTISGLVLNASYGPESNPASLEVFDRDIAQPGQYPYTRGLHAEGYRSRLWTMRQFAGFGSADDTNRRFKYLLEQAKSSTKVAANTGLSTAFDLPTLMGRDSDDELSIGEVGRCGVAIASIEDMHRLYADIPIGQVTVSQTINGPAAVIWAMYLAHAKQRGISWDTLGGTLQNDILKEFHSQNEFIYPPDASVKLVVDTIEFQTRLVPRWNSVSISGYHIREAGSNAIQELAFTLRDGMEYVEACLERGMDIDEFAPRLSYFFNSHNEFFEEICKLRAARRIWARIMRQRYGAKNPKSWLMRTHVQTAGCSLTEQQPLNNIVRVAYQAMAAALGGCQSLHTDSMDETLGLPTEQAVTVALRTQQILAFETGVTRTVDPLGGSWFIESLTDQMESGALDLLHEIDRMGTYSDWSATTAAATHTPETLESHPAYQARRTFGKSVIAGINRGYFRRQIAEASYRFSEECEAGDRIIVGLNAFKDDSNDRPIDILQISHDVEVQQNQRLASFKAHRDPKAVLAALDRLRRTCRDGDPGGSSLAGDAGYAHSAPELGLDSHNVMPALINASLCNCTLGEMVQAMADVYGRYSGGPEW